MSYPLDLVTPSNLAGFVPLFVRAGAKAIDRLAAGSPEACLGLPTAIEIEARLREELADALAARPVFQGG